MEERKNTVQFDKCLLRAQEKAADPGSANSKTWSHVQPLACKQISEWLGAAVRTEGQKVHSKLDIS